MRGCVIEVLADAGSLRGVSGVGQVPISAKGKDKDFGCWLSPKQGVKVIISDAREILHDVVSRGLLDKVFGVLSRAGANCNLDDQRRCAEIGLMCVSWSWLRNLLHEVSNG